VSPAGNYGVQQILEVEAVLHVRGRGVGGLDDATVELLAIGRRSGDVVAIPLQLHQRRRRLHIRSRVRLADVFASTAPSADTVQLLLRLVWRNSATDLVLAVPGTAHDASVQLAYEPGGAVTLTRFSSIRDE
jgi:hypothetical protein